MRLKPGLRLFSAVDATEVIVVRWLGEDEEVTVECGGVPMVPARPDRAATSAVVVVGPVGTVGKRYTNSSESLEVLCVKGGSAAMTCDGTALQLKQAKALPSSD